jgi:hypothetical protein
MEQEEPHRRGASAERLALGKAGAGAPAYSRGTSSEAFEHLVTTPVKRELRGAARSSLNAPGVRTFSAGGEAAYVPFAAGARRASLSLSRRLTPPPFTCRLRPRARLLTRIPVRAPPRRRPDRRRARRLLAFLHARLGTPGRRRGRGRAGRQGRAHPQHAVRRRRRAGASHDAPDPLRREEEKRWPAGGSRARAWRREGAGFFPPARFVDLHTFRNPIRGSARAL